MAGGSVGVWVSYLTGICKLQKKLDVAIAVCLRTRAPLGEKRETT